MKIFYCTNFRGVYPVGTSAVIVATSIGLAAYMLEQELKKAGLEQNISANDLVEINPFEQQVLILNNGDY